MKPFKVEKIAVQAKSRALKATWTVEAVQDLKVNHDIDLENELADMLAEEIHREQIKALCKQLGWTEVLTRNTAVDTEWCEKYIKHRYHNTGSSWFFEDERDAHFFMLKWGIDH
jgi:hypothetical protein